MVLLRTKRGGNLSLHKVVIYLPQFMVDYINLYSLANKKRRGTLITNVLRDWYDGVYEVETEDILIDIVVHELQNQWDLVQRTAKTRKRFADFDEFLDQAEAELGTSSYGAHPKLNANVVKSIIRILDEKNKR